LFNFIFFEPVKEKKRKNLGYWAEVVAQWSLLPLQIHDSNPIRPSSFTDIGMQNKERR